MNLFEECWDFPKRDGSRRKKFTWDVTEQDALDLLTLVCPCCIGGSMPASAQ